MTLRLRLLGGVEGVGGAAVGPVSGPKRLALLAYLAVSAPRGFRRRDTLVGLFWPELPDRRARDALNRLLYLLRRDLGPDVVVSRGQEEVGLAAGRVWCDVVAFEEALEAGDARAALELYRGELLPGFFLPDAPEFERWVERERSRLRERAVLAALSLGAGDAAVAWARRAQEIAPDDERVLRRLMEALDGAGDRAGALREYDAFARQLAAEHGAGPSAETQALAEAIRGRSTLILPPAVSAGEASRAAVREAAGVAGASRAPPAGAFPAGVPARADPAAGRGRWHPAQWSAAARVAAASAAVAVIALAAAWLGSMTDRAPAAHTGPGGGLGGGGDTETLDLTAARAGRTAFGGRLPAAASTRSIEALEAYVAGERALRAGRYLEAIDRFQRAVSEDTGFALAYYRLSRAANWTGDESLVRRAADAAARHGARLTARRRRLVEAWRSYVYGAGAEALRAARALVAADSLDADAWFLLGESLFHWGPTLGRSVEESGPAFAHVLALEPTNVGALQHLARVAARAARVGLLDTLALQLAGANPPRPVAFELEALRAWSAADTAAMRRVATELRVLDHGAIRGIVISVAADAEDPAGAAWLFPRLVVRGGDPIGKASIYLLAVHLELARGRFQAADRYADSVAAYDPALGLDTRAMLATLPFRPVPASERAAVRAELDDPPAADPARDLFGPDNARLDYTAGLLDAREGDLPGALRRAARIAGLPVTATAERVSRGTYAAVLRAAAERAAGRPAAALLALDSIPVEADSTLPTFFDHPQARARWLRAETLAALGRDEEALRWYATFPDASGFDVAYMAPAYLARAAIHERRGETRLAIRAYERALALWREADPALRPRIREAENALARLRKAAAAP